MNRMSVRIAVALAVLTLFVLLPEARRSAAQTQPNSATLPTLTLTANAVVRAWPSGAGEVVGALPARASVPAAGRLEDGTWWMVPYPSAPSGNGWVSAAVVQPNSAADSVPVYVMIEPPPEATPLPTPVRVQCVPGAKYVADVTIPDGTIVAAGQPFDKVWRIRNTGTCAWDAGTTLSWVGGFRLAGSASVAVAPTAPGDVADVGVTLIGPYQPGQYSGIWQMADSTGGRFGDRVTVVVAVQGAAPPPLLPTPTSAPPPPGPYINFWADRTSLNAGECMNLHWDVEGVQAIYLQYDGKDRGVTGHESKEVCPTSSRNYRLLVIMPGGSQEVRDIQVHINNPLPPASIEFGADNTQIRDGQCTTVWWKVKNARRVRFQSKDVNHKDSREVCPHKRTTYRLQVENLDGQKRDRSVEIKVRAPR